MKKTPYTQSMDKIKASDSFIESTKELLQKEFNENQEIKKMKSKKHVKIYKLTAGLAACCALIVGGIFAFSADKSPEVTPTTPPAPPIGGKQVVNIEGVITEVSEDGTRIKVGEQWVIITEDTELGITGPNAAPKDEQYFDKEFKVGNSIAGFTLDDPKSDEVIAYAIYSNWNWDN